MKNQIKRIQNDIQDRNSEAWKKLCEYIDELAESGGEEFAPYEALGVDLYRQIYTLPESISKLKKVTKVWLYGSSLKRIPPEIGEMESLEYFDPYTSYDLNWFPYEITRCKNLKDSRISTRALFGNYKHRKPFPLLNHNPVRCQDETVKCSICDKQMSYDETEQYWISLNIGTDVVPLLANICSDSCKAQFPTPPNNYIPHPHKGGADQEQPPDEMQRWEEAREKLDRGEKVEGFYTAEELQEKVKKEEKKGSKGPKLLRVIWKIWDK